MKLGFIALAATSFTLLASTPAGAAQTQKTDPETGATTWQTQAHGVTFSLTQIAPDPGRAFYLNRGFPPEAAEHYATACVYSNANRVYLEAESL